MNHTDNLKNAKGIIVTTLPSGKTEYQLPSNGTNSFNHDGGFSLKAMSPRRNIVGDAKSVIVIILRIRIAEIINKKCADDEANDQNFLIL